MIKAYINLDKNHASFLQLFKDAEIKKISLKSIKNQNEIDIALTSLSKYGETNKNLSDLEWQPSLNHFSSRVKRCVTCNG